ncbi:MAG: SMC family ATPase [Thermotogae bacterium]|uniref:AAA family ATPase n=2 Tax=Kosmotogaceae TaxID=1643948 RepID=UPI0002CC6E35|nr:MULTISPECIES: SMC family ATPase [Mesotoga]MCP5457010.1 SMC family ATPase [Thermotogota bacterium]CCU83990.1 SMC domain protein [Mesotoga infera]MCP5460227.1 SMC family ATPase [Thermotogota bacterium]HNQ69778.1 SMC family ATPase [Mesotoga prima]HNS75105.1 SMC family ATPase [Mesotoga prima]
MRITSIDLENFRSHSRYSGTFEKGINLILGRNGSGKSSIIEAIGLALFGGGLRDRQEDAVRWNERRARIKVAFLADDGLEYVVEKVFGNASNHELYQGELLVARGRENVIEKIRTICGLQGDISRTFENVIVAFQNKIADQFLGSPAVRRDYFNRVFQVDLYRKISTDFMRSYVSDLRNEDEFLRREIAILDSQLERKEEVKERMAQLLKDLSLTKKELDTLRDTLTKIRSEKTGLEEVSRELASRKSSLERELVSLKDASGNLKNNLKQRERAKRAKEIVDESREAHDLYEKLLKEENILNTEKRRLEGLAEESSRIGRKISEFEIEITRLTESLSNKNNRLREINERFEAQKMERSGLIGEKEAAELESGKKRMAYELSVSKKKAFKVIYEQYRENERRINALEDLWASVQNLESVEELNLTLQKIDEEIEKTNQEVRILEKLNEAKTTKSAQKKALKEYEGSLAKGICPLLNERCRNIENREDYGGYIAELIKGLEEGERELLKEIKKVEDTPSRLNELLGEKTLTLKAIEERAKKESEKSRIEEEKSKLMKTHKKLILELSSISGVPAEVEQMSEEIEREIREASTELELQNKQVSSLADQIKRIDSQIEELIIGRNILDEEKKETEKAIASLRTETANLRSSLEEYAKELDKLPEFNTRIEETRRTMALNKAGYENYNRFATLAGYLEEYASLCQSSLEKCRNTSLSISKIRKEYSSLQRAFDSERFEQLRIEEKAVEEKYNLKRDETVSIGRDLLSAKTDLKNLADIEKQKKTRQKTIEKIGKKVKLAEKIRENLNLTGERITAGFRDAIERKATLDYMRISGMEETIRWNEDYEVSVKAPEYEGGSIRSFSNLSGGEQVLVSLCLRAAMTGILSGARFAVFDEPTSNLDKERKELLAHSLRELFGELDQSIIVTHDDVFSEMAQKVIRLEPAE